MATAALSWVSIADVSELTAKRCMRLYAELGKSHDLVLIYTDEKFYAMEARCGHQGGPLYQGDIEDYKGCKHVVCPWHGYKYNVETGACEIGIRQEVFETKVEDDKLYVNYKCALQLQQFT